MTITAEQAAKLLDGTTPGPWRADGPPYNRIVWSSADNRVCFMAHTNGLDNARDDANSNLVAAAPDLARALIASEAARKLAEERLAVAQLIARQGKDTIATVLLLEIAAALTEHERVVLTRDETSLGPRIMEFADILKEIGDD